MGVIGRSGRQWNAERKMTSPHAGPQGADGRPVQTAEGDQTVWAVLDEAGRVVVMASGADAPEFAAEWAERGARVVELRADSVAAA